RLRAPTWRRPPAQREGGSALGEGGEGQLEIHVGALCRELGVTRQTRYRHVAPNGALRPDGQRLLDGKRKGADRRSWRGQSRTGASIATQQSVVHAGASHCVCSRPSEWPPATHCNKTVKREGGSRCV